MQHAYPVNQSPNATKPTLGSILTSLYLTHLLFFLSLFLTLYPTKASCFPLYLVALWTVGKEDSPLHDVLNHSLVSSKSSSFVIFHSYKEQG